MGVITISRQYGSGGLAIGRMVAEILSYRYINKDLVIEVAREAEIPLSDIERFDECPESAATRLVKKLLLSPYPSNFTGESIEEPFQYAFRDGFGSTILVYPWLTRMISFG